MRRITVRGPRTAIHAGEMVTFGQWFETLVNCCPHFSANLAQAREGNALKAAIVSGAEHVDVQEDVYQALANLAKSPGLAFRPGYVMATVDHAEHLLSAKQVEA